MNEKIKEKNQAILKKYFPNHLWPDEVYKNKIKSYISDGVRIGHLGCGRDLNRVYEVINGAKVFGIDFNLESLKEYKTGERIRANLEKIPFRDEYFDLLISEFVFEHIEYPENVINECKRILKRNGKIIFLTINKFSLSGIISSFTPQWFHKFVRRRMLEPQFYNDVFKTYYRFNSTGKIRKIFKDYGFKEIELTFLEAEISYFDKSPALLELGCIVNKFIMTTKILQPFQTYLLGIFEKE